jgi:hypothetical protein
MRDAGFSCRRPTFCAFKRNRRVSNSLSLILYLFLAPAGELYLKIQDVLAHDEAYDASPPAIVAKRRSGPKHSKYGIPAELWPTVVYLLWHLNIPPPFIGELPRQ